MLLQVCKNYRCVATKLEQYTCAYLIDYLTFSWFVSSKKARFLIEELLDYLFSFCSCNFLIKIVWPPCSPCSAACTVWLIAHAPDDDIMSTCVLLEHGRKTKRIDVLLQNIQKKFSTSRKNSQPSNWAIFSEHPISSLRQAFSCKK